MKTETKVGSLVIAAALGLGWLTSQGNVGGGTSLSDARELSSVFANVEGINAGSKVKIAGLDVGQVTSIELNPNGSATIHMAVKEDSPLPANVTAGIATSGLIGEKFITLSSDFAAKGQLGEDVLKIPSAGSADPANVAADFSKIADDLKQVTSALRSALGGPENAEKLGRIIDSIDGLSSKMNNGIGDDQVERIVTNLESFSSKLNKQSGDMVSDLRDSAASLKKILADNEGSASSMLANLGHASKSLAKITDKMASGKGMLGQMLMEENSSIADFTAAMDDLQSITAKINNGEGTIGRLINDPATAEKIEGALDSFSELTGRMEQFRTEVDFQGYQLASEEVGKGSLNITFRPRPTRYYVLGVTSDGFATEAADSRSNASFRGEEFGEDLKFTAQFGHVFESAIGGKDLGFRIGLKDSTFGMGADISFWDNFVEVSADVYDLTGQNSGRNTDVAHVDLKAKVMLVDKTLYAVGGYDNVLNQEYGSPFIGLGFRFQDDDLKYMIGQAL